MNRSPRLPLFVSLVLALAAGPVAGVPAQAEEFLGYEIGEERRYVLGPETSLVRGEIGIWSIRLEEVYEAASGRPEGVFALTHQWRAPQPVVAPPLGAITRVESEGSMRVNRHGYPLMIRYQTIRHLAGFGEEAYTIDFEIDDEGRRYNKRTTKEGDRWYQEVAIRDHDSIDRKGAAGLFAYLPTVPGCLDRLVASYELQGATVLQPRSADTQPGAQTQLPSTVRVVDNADCEETLFANPGLLAFAMPALWEALGEREYVFFTPIGPVGEPRTGVAVAMPGSGQPYGPGAITRQPGMGGMGVPTTMGRLEPEAMSSSTYHEIETLEFIERTSVRVGSRTRDAWLIRMTEDVGPVYVDDEGNVLRIDLPPMPDAPERFIRMLWPSEF